MKPEISVIVPSHQYNEHLRKCLLSLKAQKNINFEVLVVANPDNQAIRVFAKAMGSQFKYLSCASGVNRARQEGAQAAKSDWLFYLDSDCQLINEAYLFQVSQKLQNSTLQAWGGLYEIPKESSSWSQTYHDIQIRWLSQAYLENSYVNFLLGGHFAIRKELILQYGFDTSIIYGGSETDLFARLAGKNFRFQLDTDFVVRHQGDIGFRDFCRKAYRQGQGQKRQMEKNLYIPPKFINLDLYQSCQTLGFAHRVYEFCFSCGFSLRSWPRNAYKIFFERSFQRKMRRALQVVRFYQNWLSQK